jgi:hypothetical protein
MNDPVNDLAQLWLWRLEARVIGTVVAWGVVGLWLLIYAVAGAEAAYYVFPLSVAAVGVVIACSLLYVAEILIFGDPRREAATTAAYQLALKQIGADIRYD